MRELVGAPGWGRDAKPLTSAVVFPTATARGRSFTINLPDEEATARFAADVAVAPRARRSGDAVQRGGRGQDHVRARAHPLSRKRRGDRGAEPDFRGLQSYELPSFPLVHADFYGCAGAAELAEPSRFWPPGTAVLRGVDRSRSRAFCRPDRIDETSRSAPQFGPGVRETRGWRRLRRVRARFERIPQVRAFLDQTGYRDVPRGPHGRRRLDPKIFERLVLRGRAERVLMNSPQTEHRCATASPTARSRISPRTWFPYSGAGAGSARDRNLPGAGGSCKPISSTASSSWRIWATIGSSPAIRGAPIEQRYEAAVDLLLSLHRRQLRRLPVAPRGPGSAYHPTTWMRS